MYVAVKGGEAAIANAHDLLARQRRGNENIPSVSCKQISEQLSLGVARVMAEGSLFDPELAALALKQARGDTIEAVFLLRAYRNTLQRFGYSVPVDTAHMQIERRISATFKDLPGGQLLGPTFDYTHRLLDPDLLRDDKEGADKEGADKEGADEVGDYEERNVEERNGKYHNGEAMAHTGDNTATLSSHLSDSDSNLPDATPHTVEMLTAVANNTMPRVTDLLAADSLIEEDSPYDPEADDSVDDITRQPLNYPLSRQARLQALARGDEGFLLAMGYSTQRGYGRNHPFAGEIRVGLVSVEAWLPELGFSLSIGSIQVTECQMINQFAGSKTVQPRFTRGYGLVFGHGERKAMSMALVDRALRAKELGEDPIAPAQDEEFVIAHSDNVQATGFVEHLKLPHYVDFQAELELLRRMRAEVAERIVAKQLADSNNGAGDEAPSDVEQQFEGEQQADPESIAVKETDV